MAVEEGPGRDDEEEGKGSSSQTDVKCAPDVLKKVSRKERYSL